ncbi:hypothetical protein OHO28_47895 [Streptomyces europaeiscabiei]|uniref:hypothetical protein n=1 Tax=Streptomyces europaeiscabiei TaxID=146819 RepID=UPI002E171935
MAAIPAPGVSVSPALATRASTRPCPAALGDTDLWGRSPIGLRLCGVDRLLAHETATDRTSSDCLTHVERVPTVRRPATDRTSTDRLTSAGFREPARTDRRRERGI